MNLIYTPNFHDKYQKDKDYCREDQLVLRNKQIRRHVVSFDVETGPVVV
jgi:hypothetical protein